MKVPAVVKATWICTIAVSFQHSVVDGVGEAVGFIDECGVDFQFRISLSLIEPVDSLS